MDMSHYTSVFVAECRELLEILNHSVVALERDPSNAAIIDEVFRCAHSLKGASSTMGFDTMARLTHELEHVLNGIRSEGAGMSLDVANVLLASLDLLDAALDGVEGGTGDVVPIDVVVAQLRALDTSGEDEPVADRPATPGDIEPECEADADDPFADDVVAALPQLVVRIADDCESASIRAFMVFTAVESLGEIVAASPGADEVDTFDGRTLRFAVASEAAPGQFERALLRISEVTDVQWTAAGAGSCGAGQALSADSPDEAGVAAPAQSTPCEPADGGGGEPGAASASAPSRRLSGTVRIDAARLDQLMHLVGEVVVHRTNVEARVRAGDLAGANAAVQELRRSTQAMQAQVMNVRMVPVETAFSRLPRLVRDLSAKLGKDVSLVVTGADTEIDRSVVDALSDPLVHLIRNAMDHGIEQPTERASMGKQPSATLEISAGHSGGNVVIDVVDDGRGIDADRVRERAVARGLVTREAADQLTPDEVVELLFLPGFSTAEQTTDVSGRGVGMDAVRAMCREWGGGVSLTSEAGRGCRARIRIPLTLAVMNVLMVEAPRGRRLAIPIDRIERTVQMAGLPVGESGPHARAVRLDGEVVGLTDLATATGYGTCADERYGVVVRVGAGHRVFAVDRLVGEVETVTKPLPRAVACGSAFMGGAVQGDGSVALILDCERAAEQITSLDPRADTLTTATARALAGTTGGTS
jgi:two-component system chemotaxis sensor kinase CheA